MKSPNTEKKIDNILKKYVPDLLPGTVVFIGRDGEEIYNKGHGMADIENNIPATNETAFMIASVTKQFTDMAIMILKERGCLKYDETIEKYFPDFPSYISKITIRHLMTHTSGIPDYFTEEFIERSIKTNGKMTQKEVLEEIKGLTELEFESGTDFSYSNSGYVMLGYIIEIASGLTFDQFLSENIFRPLNMDRTIVGTSDEHIEGAAFGYMRNKDGAYEKAPYNLTVVGWADGNMITIAEDLFKWHKALYTEKLVKKETLEEAFTPYILEDGTSTNYGFGWFNYNRRGVKEIWHSGGTVGFTCRFSRFIDEDVAIIMLTNLDSSDANKTPSIFGEIVDVALGDRLIPVKTKNLSVEELKKFIGTYKGKEGRCEVTYNEALNKLVMKNDLERLDEEITLTPVDYMDFRIDSSAEYYVKFNKIGNTISQMTLELNGSIRNFKTEY